jgi:hypothetical protein
MVTMGNQTLVQGMQECIDNCEKCHDACMQTVTYCLTQGGEHVSPNHIGILMDCADICKTSADFMLRNSPRHGLTCAVCAQVCDACAQDCEAMGADSCMAECAQICRQCAESCRVMADAI